MQLPFSLNIKQYRSINDSCAIPFTNRTTFIVGQNNSGKSNILRGLAAIFNKDYAAGDINYKYEFTIKNDEFVRFSNKFESMRNALLGFDGNIKFTVENGNISHKNVSDEIRNYTSSNGFMHDFRYSADAEANLQLFFQRVFQHIEPNFRGSVYVPNVRYITQPGREPDHFSKTEIAGTVIEYGKIVEEFSSLNHPRTEVRVENRDRFSKIQDFLAYCLDKAKVRIEVPFDKSTIHVDIDGAEYPLQDLGTGIEQLLIIGLASFGFSGKLTLIDEPELHFHPSAQKRMVKYLNDNVDSLFIFATHSAAILDAVEADVLQVTNDGTRSIVQTVSSSKERYQAVRDLGYSPSDLLLTKFAIWVEGPSDRIYVKNWIYKIDPKLTEGIDYTILFYGGKILSHHSFIDAESELVKAVSLAKAFAVIMDSDRRQDRPNINKTKSRVRDEIETQGGICWITDGREIENYLPDEVIRQVAKDFPGVSVPTTKLDQVLDPEKVKKNDFARAAIALNNDEWPLDLKKHVMELVEAIRRAR